MAEVAQTSGPASLAVERVVVKVFLINDIMHHELDFSNAPGFYQI
jgi:hypothetical protein